MKCSFDNLQQAWIYEADKYKFRLMDEKYHRYETLVITEKNLLITQNLTMLSNDDLKSLIVKEWFLEENQIVRERNNKKRRAANARGEKTQWL